MIRIQGIVVIDDYGLYGYESLVGVLAESGNHISKLVYSCPYSELRFGASPFFEAQCLMSRIPLSIYLKQNPSMLGLHEADRLNFNIRICSKSKMSDLQVFPTKSFVASCKARCDSYNVLDFIENAAVIVALKRPYYLLVGFRSPKKIFDLLFENRALVSLLDISVNYTNLLHNDPAIVKKTMETIARCFLEQEPMCEDFLRRIHLSIIADCSSHVSGVLNVMLSHKKINMYLVSLLMNVIMLDVHEGFEICAAVPFILLPGVFMEVCLSHNIFKAGLVLEKPTKKYVLAFKDSNLFLKACFFSQLDPFICERVTIKNGVVCTIPATIKDFIVKEIREPYFINDLGSSAMLLVMCGRVNIKFGGRTYAAKEGDVFFIPYRQSGKLEFYGVLCPFYSKNVIPFVAFLICTPVAETCHL